MTWLEEQFLGMKWLSNTVEQLLRIFGMNQEGAWYGSLHFFIYDIIKITILLCVVIFLISWLQSYFSVSKSKKIINRFHGIWANIMAALLGTVTPFCSCSSIPLFIGFTKAGIPLNVTFSFLISSPMVDLASLVLLMSIFGWKVAVTYVVLGLMIAVIGGRVIGERDFSGEINPEMMKDDYLLSEQEELSLLKRWRDAAERTWILLRYIFPYICFGVAIGAIIHNWIPLALIEGLLGQENIFGVILGTFVGVPIYADIFGTIPVAEALLAKGALLGTVLSFMMAVTTLSLPSLIMLRKVMSRKLLMTFISVCTIGIILSGYVFNGVQAFLLI